VELERRTGLFNPDWKSRVLELASAFSVGSLGNPAVILAMYHLNGYIMSEEGCIAWLSFYNTVLPIACVCSPETRAVGLHSSPLQHHATSGTISNDDASSLPPSVFPFIEHSSLSLSPHTLTLVNSTSDTRYHPTQIEPDVLH
jgi:hypothetical protein